jgi:hypothetical protein
MGRKTVMWEKVESISISHSTGWMNGWVHMEDEHRGNSCLDQEEGQGGVTISRTRGILLPGTHCNETGVGYNAVKRLTPENPRVLIIKLCEERSRG